MATTGCKTDVAMQTGLASACLCLLIGISYLVLCRICVSPANIHVPLHLVEPSQIGNSKRSNSTNDDACNTTDPMAPRYLRR